MGSIVSDFPQLLLETDPNRYQRNKAGTIVADSYQQVYDDLTALGLPVPAQAVGVVTRAQLVAHLQAQAGALIKAELNGDPDNIGYAGAPDDATRAQLLCNAYILATARRWPGSSLTGYQAAAGSTATGLVVVTNPGLGAPGLLSLNGLAGAASIRFRASAATVANRGVVMPIQIVPTDTTLTFAAPLPGVPTVGDIFDLGLTIPPRQAAKLSQILARFPFAPNLLTAADITAAKV